MAILNENNQLALVVSSNTTTSSYEGLLESQKELLNKQIGQLQYIVSTQCKLTGVNPLSQEMAAGALSIKIGKRPRDLLNPKAIKYMQSIFSLKDEISKKEIRAISALFGLTATQVRDFFTGQRSRVRRLIRLSREKASQSTQRVEEQDGTLCSNLDLPIHPVPLNSMGPSSSEAPSCSMQDEVMPGMDDSDKYFIDNIFILLRKEETFAGQVKLLEWVLQIQNASVLYWFLTNGGVMILATWLSQAAIEEQTSVLHVILRVLCHLPLHKALPAHMSAILQSVNKLRFYRGSDISNRAKSLLSRWSKMFARSQAMRRPNAVISAADTQNEMLLKQSIGEIMENESLESRIDIPGATLSLQGNSENSRNSGSSQSIKLITAPSDDSNVKLLRGVSSSHTRERRKVQLVEQPGQKMAGRNSLVTRPVSTAQGRPLSADDIQKAKMRAQFMRSKYGDLYRSPLMPPTSQASTALSASKVNSQTKVDEHLPSTSQANMTLSASETHVQPKVEEYKKPVKLMPGATVQGKGNLDSEEPIWKKCKRFQISWVTPPAIMINNEWGVCAGENSKEIDVQNNRIRREKEVFYKTDFEIPANPKEPWDREIDYDDSLTPEIPTDQLPDDDTMVAGEISGHKNLDSACTTSYAAGTTSESSNTNMPEPDLELLAVLLKNPEIVFALTSGQGGNLSSEQTVKLLDAIKANGVGNLMNNLVEKKEENKVEVSLPSPTPSSNPVTSGWPPESAKNLFSRQNVTVNGDAYAIPAVYFQENSIPAPAPTIPPVTRQEIAPAIHQRFPVSGRRNLPDVVSDHRNLPDLAMVADRRNTPDLVTDRRNIPAAGRTPSSAYFSPEPMIPEPSLLPPAQAWTTRQGSASSSYSPADRGTNYNAYGTRDYNRSGPSWVRNDGYGHEPGFESWSPDNSPDRSREFVAGRNYSEAGMFSGRGHSYNYGPEMSRTQRDPSRYRDRGGRNENSRWRDRRR